MMVISQSNDGAYIEHNSGTRESIAALELRGVGHIAV